MNAPEWSIETQRWLRFAMEDLDVARAIVAGEHGVARLACWHAQQAAEKTLKAGLIFHQISFPRTLDLDLLNQLLPTSWRIIDQADRLSELSEWAVEARYPGDWPEAMASDAERAVQTASVVDQWIREKIEVGELNINPKGT